MTTFPNSPRLIKGGIVLIDPETSAVQNIIALQYNPDTITRTLQVQSAASESGNRSEALRLRGPPVETITLEIQIDDHSQFEKGESNAVSMGIYTAIPAKNINACS